LHLQLCENYRAGGDYPQAKQHAEVALDHFRTSEDQQGLAQALKSLGEAVWWLRDFDRAELCFSEAYELSRRIGDEKTEAWMLKDLGQTAYLLGDTEKAKTLLRESLGFHQHLPDKTHLAWIHFDLARLLLVLGEYPEALEHDRAALKLFNQIGHKSGVIVSRVELGQLWAITGKLAEAQETFAQNALAVLELHESDALFDFLLGYATLLSQLGHKERAMTVLLRVFGQPLGNPFTQVRAQQLLNQLEAELPPSVVEAVRQQSQKESLEELVRSSLGPNSY
jgi:tetratricopeptide (TPR) repeat protein